MKIVKKKKEYRREISSIKSRIQNTLTINNINETLIKKEAEHITTDNKICSIVPNDEISRSESMYSTIVLIIIVDQKKKFWVYKECYKFLCKKNYYCFCLCRMLGEYKSASEKSSQINDKETVLEKILYSMALVKQLLQ